MLVLTRHKGKLFDRGMDTPSGSYIAFSGSREKAIGLKRARTGQVKQAKPRLAVALDYADLMCREAHGEGVFSKFESHTDEGPFTLAINPKARLPEVDWIASITFYVHQNGNKAVAHEMGLVRKEGWYEATLNINADALKDLAEQNKVLMFFLSIQLNPSIVEHLPTDYSIDTPWTFQVELLSKKKVLTERLERTARKVENQGDDAHSLRRYAERQIAAAGGFIIQRHATWGEVPKHRKYTDIDSSEYKYPWEEKLEHNKKKSHS